MRTVSSLVRRVLVRAKGGVKKGPTLKAVRGPSKLTYRGRKGA